MSNHLQGRASRYLAQHAENPVDWYPWSELPFRRAASEGKPLLVSIGYSSCHWCHVMAHESFEDAEVARILNESFVAIKVDKEELPDVDGFYMEFLTQLTGRGGWPLNVFVNPNRAPFYGITYLPRGELAELLPYVAQEYARHEEIRTQRIDRLFAVGRMTEEQIRARLDGIALPAASHAAGPQFPQGLYLTFALRRGERTMVQNELVNLVTKGLFDHVEGGWFRYAVDPDFQIPHFEKMLYDQAALLLLCAEARPIAPRMCDYAVHKTVGWLEERMRLPSGLYGSATDADTAEGEGAYYTMEECADAEEQVLFRREECGLHEGRFQPWIDLDLWARMGERAEEIVRRHRALRAQRLLPGLDTKAVVSWNCFLGYDLLRCAEAAADPSLADMAERLYRSIERLTRGGVAHVVYGEKPLSGEAYLEDWASLLLFTAARPDSGASARRSSEELLAEIRKRFFSGELLFHTTERPFESLSLWQDAPVPSGGAMLLTALLELGRPEADGLARLAIAEVAAANPAFFGLWCGALDRAYGGERR